jgi:hypothetical protein
MNLVTRILIRLGILKDGLDYHLVRASMVIVFLFFGYSKWFNYEAQGLIPYISHGPLIAWMYPVFGIRGAGRFLGVSEWSFGALLLSGFWNQKLGTPWSHRFVFYIYRDGDDHPISAEWLGSLCRRISRNDRRSRFPDEGRGSLCCLVLSIEAGCATSVFQGTNTLNFKERSY